MGLARGCSVEHRTDPRRDGNVSSNVEVACKGRRLPAELSLSFSSLFASEMYVLPVTSDYADKILSGTVPVTGLR